MTTLQKPEDRFQDFLRSCRVDGEHKYRKRLGHVALSGSRSIVVDFDDLIAFDPDLARSVLDKPDEYFEYLDRSAWAQLKIEDPEYAEIVKRLRVRFRKLPERNALRKIGSENIGRLLLIDGIIVRATSVKPLLIKAAFQCRKCNAMSYVEQAGTLMRGPGVCAHCRSKVFEFMEKQSTFMNSQEIRIQERPEDLPPGQLPRAMDIKLSEDLVDIARPGDRVSITGIARAQQEFAGRKARLRTFELQLDANYVDVVGKEIEVVEITPEDERQIRELAKDPFIHRKLIASLAPSIYGYGDIKEAVLYLLFSGVPKRLPDGVTIRGETNVLLVGDPGTAKSQLLQYVSRIAPRGLYTSGRGTSLDYDEPIFVRQGGVARVMAIGELVDGYYRQAGAGFISVADLECLSYNAVTGNVEWSPVSHVYRHPYSRPLTRIKLQTGRQITVTNDHSIYVFQNGDVKAIQTGEIRAGDCVAVPRMVHETQPHSIDPTSRFGPLAESPDLARMLGYYVAEGYLHEGKTPGKQSYRIHFEINSNERHIFKAINDSARRLFGVSAQFRRRPTSNGATVTITSKEALLLFRDTLRVARGARQKRIPEIIFNMRPPLQAQFLKAYLEGDRGVTASRLLMSDLLYLIMQCMGIVGKFVTRRPSTGWVNGRRIAGGPHYQLKSPDPYFLETPVRPLDPPLEHALPVLQAISKSPKSGISLRSHGYTRLTENVLTSLMKGRRAKRVARLGILRHDGWTSAKDFASRNQMPSRLARAYLQRCNHDGLVQRSYPHGRLHVILTSDGHRTLTQAAHLSRLVKGDLQFAEVLQIQQVKHSHKYVYDVCVPGRENFVAGLGGILCHNTAAGLTAAVMREKSGGMVLEAGALVLADKGVACIDEIDKMRPDDRVAIHEALEQHTVSVAKGGIVATLNARAAVLAAANPSLGRYDPYRNITDNINLPVTLLSRFDLLFIMKDVPEPDADSRMSDHILTLHRLKAPPEAPPLTPELLRKYIAYAKRIDPVLTEEAVVEIRQYYMKMRSLSGSTESPVAITPRQLEALVRLGEARARSFLRDRVEGEDARSIIRLMTLSLQDVGIDTTTGKIDIDVIMTGKPKSLRDKMQVVLSTFADLEKQLGIVEEPTLYQALSRKVDITDEEARRLVQQLVREGILYAPKAGHLKRTAA